MIVARCIIYDKVYNFPDGRTPLRLAERQYSSDGKDQYKRMLIDKLVANGLIDGYKAIGASCNDSMNFVDVNGNSMRRRFFIESRWQKSKPLSYQDSFKWADTVHCRAYNFDRDCEYRLDTTSLTINSTDMRWSEYHGRFLHKRVAFYDRYHNDYRLAENAKPCIYKGESIYIDLSNDDDFRYSPLRKAHVHISEYV